jgi:hypothetical protein
VKGTEAPKVDSISEGDGKVLIDASGYLKTFDIFYGGQ